MRFLPVRILPCLLLLAVWRADGALVVFGDGRLLRVDSFGLEGADRIVLSLPGGGRMTIPLELIDRIVDDEYERPALPNEPDGRRPASAGADLSQRSVRAFEEKFPVVSPYSKEILQAAREFRIDPALIAAVIKAESNFVPSAISPKGARGLMQLMPATARRMGVGRDFDPRENIRGGTAYLAELAARFGETSVELILAAYNAGERAVEDFGGVPPYRETQAYVKKVTALWRDAWAARPSS
ncbi:MAG TPA: lytic transglycosylase domain-containing protein [Thermoanaerobaculia bacterium]|nr:lytic transglycosylase domain-containing protein [Thermoanaerobaculia bacterium]